jgi:hypothetical protein
MTKINKSLLKKEKEDRPVESSVAKYLQLESPKKRLVSYYQS